MAKPYPGPVPGDQIPAGAAVVWGWSTAKDGTLYPVLVDPTTGGLVLGAAGLQTTADLTGLRINNAAASGDTTLVAATASQATRVYRMKLSVAGACIVQIKDGAGTILEVFNFAGIGGGVVLDFGSRPWYIGSVNTAFIINVSAAVQVDGRLEYVKS